VFYVLNFAAISVMIYSLLWYFASEKQKLRIQVDAQHEEIRVERDRSERLLLNILPAAIAERLKWNEVNIAQGHADVTVMFADIVGFTRMTEELSPVETVKILNDVFSIFDDIADKHRVEKIKTIGDAYMAAGGIPDPQPDHAARVASLAPRMLQAVRSISEATALPLRARIGIHSGAVVAGVLGTRKFVYDVWGDTVNTASRMESHSLPGRIQVSAATRAALGPGFTFEPRGALEIKGKGLMETWFLVEAPAQM
jgi:class 3 adenylate cyclase